MYLSLIITFLLLLGIIVTSVQNSVPMELKFFFWKLQISLAALIFYFTLAGATIVGVLSLPTLVIKYLKVRSMSREISGLKKRILAFEKERVEKLDKA